MDDKAAGGVGGAVGAVGTAGEEACRPQGRALEEGEEHGEGHLLIAAARAASGDGHGGLAACEDAAGRGKGDAACCVAHEGGEEVGHLPGLTLQACGEDEGGVATAAGF